MRSAFGTIVRYTPFTLLVGVLLLANGAVYAVLYIEESRPPLTVRYLDVGQGDATLVEAGNGNRMLIDAGGGAGLTDTVAEYLPFYDQSIDVVVITHPHADHMNGLAPMLEYVDVGVVLDSGADHQTRTVEQYRAALEGHDITKLYARRGMVVRLSEDIIIPILFPDRNTSDLDPDNASIWTQVIHGDTRFLFTGDSFVAIEQYVTLLDGERLESNVFQAGHHGSRTSNSEDLLQVVAPDRVVVSAGKDNRHGHPHAEAMESFAAVGAEVLKTFDRGDIVFVSDGERIELVE